MLSHLPHLRTMRNVLTSVMRRILSPQQSLAVCPVCQQPGVKFLPLPNCYRAQAAQYGYKYFGRGETIALDTYSCSGCGASDRERLYAYWIDQQIQSGRFQAPTTLLHFAPEAALSKKLRKLEVFEYLTADYMMSNVDMKVDIMNMPIRDEILDCFICSHVLEHIESDDKAIGELYRITRKGGEGILMAPICLDLSHTHEDLTITTQASRWQHFGQDDHVRLYAHDDYVKKIRRHGFKVDEYGIQHFGRGIFERLGLSATSVLYIVRKA